MNETDWRFYEVRRASDSHIGVVARYADGRLFQFVAETGDFHDNPALGDDIAYERYNNYAQIDADATAARLLQVEPYDYESLGWLVERFRTQPSSLRKAAADLGLDATDLTDCSTRERRAEFAASRPHVGEAIDDVRTHRADAAVYWLWEAGSSNAGTPDLVRDVVWSLVSKALRDEPEITEDLVGCLGALDLVGIEHRVKSPWSLAKKLEAWFMARTVTSLRLDPYRIAADVPDAVRYTVLTGQHEELMSSAQDLASGLQNLGHEIVAAEHSYLPNNSYKGLKSIWIAPSRQRWELQFRSTLNLKFKDLAYPYYKLSRDLSESLDARTEAIREATRIYEQLPSPTGLDDVDAHLGGRHIEARVFESSL